MCVEIHQNVIAVVVAAAVSAVICTVAAVPYVRKFAHGLWLLGVHSAQEIRVDCSDVRKISETLRRMVSGFTLQAYVDMNSAAA